MYRDPPLTKKLYWISSPVVIPENEKADKAAKALAITRKTFVPLNDASQVVKRAHHRIW